MFESCDYMLYPAEIRALVETKSSFDLSESGTKRVELETINKKAKPG